MQMINAAATVFGCLIGIFLVFLAMNLFFRRWAAFNIFQCTTATWALVPGYLMGPLSIAVVAVLYGAEIAMAFTPCAIMAAVTITVWITVSSARSLAIGYVLGMTAPALLIVLIGMAQTWPR